MMQTVSKALVYVVTACLLLALVGSPRPRLHSARACRFGHQRRRVFARMRRPRPDNPAPHPVHPCKNALLPPDEDDNSDSDRFDGNARHERLLSLGDDPAHRTLFSTIRSQPLPTGVPRHQTLCILLI